MHSAIMNRTIVKELLVELSAVHSVDSLAMG